MDFIPIIILLAIPLITLGVHIAKHGEQMDIEYNGVIRFVIILITFALYYWAGLFDIF